MIDLEMLENKKFAYRCIKLLLENNKLNESEILILTSNDECKRLFHCSKFPILSEVPIYGELQELDCYDENGKQRFYKDKLYSCGRAFLVSNHWYGPNKSMPDNRTPFQIWVLEKIR